MATVANNAGPTAPPSGAYPSDETILGILDESGAGGNDRADDFDALLDRRGWCGRCVGRACGVDSASARALRNRRVERA